MENKFVIDKNKKCFLNGQEITRVLNVDINNINAAESTEVVITIDVDSVDVEYSKSVE